MVAIGVASVLIILLIFCACGLLGWGREAFRPEQFEQMGSKVILHFVMSAQELLADVTSVFIYRYDLKFMQEGSRILLADRTLPFSMTFVGVLFSTQHVGKNPSARRTLIRENKGLAGITHSVMLPFVCSQNVWSADKRAW